VAFVLEGGNGISSWATGKKKSVEGRIRQEKEFSPPGKGGGGGKLNSSRKETRWGEDSNSDDRHIFC